MTIIDALGQMIAFANWSLLAGTQRYWMGRANDGRLWAMMLGAQVVWQDYDKLPNAIKYKVRSRVLLTAGIWGGMALVSI
jgi:hypothetical protein